MQVTNPLPLFYDSAGEPLDAGFIYVGDANADPETSPAQVYFDPALTVPASQPLRTRGGYIVNGISPSPIYISTAGVDYSLRVKDADGDTILSLLSVTQVTVDYQPINNDLTLISNQGTTTFGRSLLLLNNQAALKAATGIAEGIPQTGGPVSGNITRTGAGPHLYHGDSALTSGKITVSAATGGNPTTQPGEIWIGI